MKKSNKVKEPKLLLEELNKLIAPYNLEYFVAVMNGFGHKSGVMGFSFTDTLESPAKATWWGQYSNSLKHEENIKQFIKEIQSGEIDLDKFFVEGYEELLGILNSRIDDASFRALNFLNNYAQEKSLGMFGTHLEDMNEMNAILDKKLKFLKKYEGIYQEVQEKGKLKQGIKLTKKKHKGSGGL